MHWYSLLRTMQLREKCREALLSVGLGTKILPEAISWHFAGTWNHMPELTSKYGKDLDEVFRYSKNLLNRSVSLPIMVDMPDNIGKIIFDALEPIFR